MVGELFSKIFLSKSCNISVVDSHAKVCNCSFDSSCCQASARFVSTTTSSANKLRLDQNDFQKKNWFYLLETLSDPWNDQRARQWFIGGDNNVRRHYDPDMPELGRLNSDNPLEIHKNSEQVPVVGQNIDIKDYQPSWQTQYKIKQKSDQKSIPNINAQSQYLPELNR